MGADGGGTAPPPGRLDLEALDEAPRRLLAYASAIGREFDFPLLVAATGGDEERTAEELERLVARGVLRERPGGDRFQFVQDEQRARIYQSLTASRLRVLHRKIAEAMERTQPRPPPEALAELGRHFFLGKVPAKSYAFNRRAAEHARATDRPEEAAHYLERARVDLAALGPGHADEEATLAADLGDLYYSTGDTRSADRLYREALARSGADPRRRARLLLGRAEVARDNLDTDTALRSAREARELFARDGDVSGLASVHRVLGRIAYHRGAYREALDEGIRALDLLQPAGDPRVLGRLCIDIGDAFARLGPEMADEAVDWYARAADRLSDVGDWAEVARAHLRRGEVVGRRRPADGLEALAVGRTFAERAHEPRWVGWALARGVAFRLALGDVEAAAQDNDLARRLLERADEPVGRVLAAINDGRIRERRGAWEEAEAAYRGAVALAQDGGLLAEVAEGQFHLARLYHKTRDLARAREAYRAAVHLDLPALDPTFAPAFAELGRALAHDDGPAPPGDDAPGA